VKKVFLISSLFALSFFLVTFVSAQEANAARGKKKTPPAGTATAGGDIAMEESGASATGPAGEEIGTDEYGAVKGDSDGDVIADEAEGNNEKKKKKAKKRKDSVTAFGDEPKGKGELKLKGKKILEN
jgi:hypothetical protein